MSYDVDESIPPQLIQDALQRVAASRDFMNSERKRRFLKFVVQETLAGRAGWIKAYTIAVDVFDRDPSFDPVTDPVVRIEAGRLRRCLERYYLAEGAADPVRITIPKGGYVPQFIMTEESALPAVQTAVDNGQPNAGGLADANPAKTAENQASAVTVSSNPFLAPSRVPQKQLRFLAAILSVLTVLITALWGATLLLKTQVSEDERKITEQAPSL